MTREAGKHAEAAHQQQDQAQAMSDAGKFARVAEAFTRSAAEHVEGHPTQRGEHQE